MNLFLKFLFFSNLLLKRSLFVLDFDIDLEQGLLCLSLELDRTCDLLLDLDLDLELGLLYLSSELNTACDLLQDFELDLLYPSFELDMDCDLHELNKFFSSCINNSYFLSKWG